MSLFAVHVEVFDEEILHADRIIGPYRSEEAAQKVADVIRGRIYTRLIKRKNLLGSTGKYGHRCRVEVIVRPIHNEAAKYHYDWTEEIILDLIGGR